ncbi:RNA polymerase sigma factor [Mesorhizobium sp. B3-1-3]|nr:RNA polymerase sigma factor [Mesorhizobium sp. B3-1-8]TPI72733.1 RNA polymerase sigma factor [Mesorhizobium sp. B3-1-3]
MHRPISSALPLDRRNQSLSGHGREITEDIPRLRRYARALLQDCGAADDLVHNSLEQARSRMGKSAFGRSSPHRLFTIIYHRFLDQSRCGKRNAQVAKTTPEIVDVIAQPSQIDRVASAEMHSALQQLAPERRAALVLVAVEGLSYSDAASALEIPADLLVSQVARGREELRSILALRFADRVTDVEK